MLTVGAATVQVGTTASLTINVPACVALLLPVDPIYILGLVVELAVMLILTPSFAPAGTVAVCPERLNVALSMFWPPVTETVGAVPEKLVFVPSEVT